MGYILLAALAVLILILAVAVVRTCRIKAAPPVPCPTEISQSEMDTAAQKLGAMVRVPCVSKREDEDLAEFFNYHNVLEAHFPLLHKTLEKEVLN